MRYISYEIIMIGFANRGVEGDRYCRFNKNEIMLGSPLI